jgi:hypothetical protein
VSSAQAEHDLSNRLPPSKNSGREVVVLVCWSVKGGVGVSVVAAALAVLMAQRGEEALLVDLAGDQPALLGVDSVGPGLGDWMEAGEDVAVDALRRLEIAVVPKLSLLASGGTEHAQLDTDRLAVALALTNRPGRTTVVDLGVVAPGDSRSSVITGAGRSVLVTRACYLALRRARDLPAEVDHQVVLVEEPGRALGRRDVAHALGVDSVCHISWEPAVARAVDAGTLAARIPGPLRRLGRLL